MSNPRSASRGRLSRSAEFERVYRHGRSTANRHLVLYSFANEAAARPRLGLSVSRKVGNAVQRNRVKRLLREAFSHAEEGLVPGQDIVLVARPPARELAEREGLGGVEASLTELIIKAGLIEEAGTDSVAAATPAPSGASALTERRPPEGASEPDAERATREGGDGA